MPKIIQILIVLIVVGFLLYLAETYIPLSPPFKLMIRVVAVLALCLFLLSAFGIVGTPVFN